MIYMIPVLFSCVCVCVCVYVCVCVCITKTERDGEVIQRERESGKRNDVEKEKHILHLSSLLKNIICVHNS